MPLLLMQLGAHPQEIAATQLEACHDGGAFFLDFSRPLGRLRWCGVWNRWLGLTMSLRVPVIHEGEPTGRRMITIDRGDPYFAELQRLWKARHPMARPLPALPVDAARIDADFAAQFPHDTAPSP